MLRSANRLDPSKITLWFENALNPLERLAEGKLVLSIEAPLRTYFVDNALLQAFAGLCGRAVWIGDDGSWRLGHSGDVVTMLDDLAIAAAQS